jgi:hypothetical protein
MMFIKIVRRPIGESPEWVRDAWIGLSLPTIRRTPRRWRTLSISRMQSGVPFPIIDVLRGRARRVSGYPVNAKAAIDLLAEKQPAAAEWWRTNAPGFVSSRQYLLFDAECCEHLGGPKSVGDIPWGTRSLKDAYPASPGRIALLWAIATLVRMFDVMLFPGDEMRSVSSALYLGSTPIFAAFLAAWALRSRASMLHLASLLVTLDLFVTCVAFGMKFISPDPEVPYWMVAGVCFAVVIGLIARGFSGLRSRTRRTAAILLLAATYGAAGLLHGMDDQFWRLGGELRPLFGRPDPFQREENAAPEIDSDVLWGAQPGLVAKQVSTFQPRIATATNVYAMAVAGSGTQAIFSREAHEALRVAARHFGGGDRGSALLSNGAVDVMQAPLATRDNIAAVAQGIGERMDRKEDVLFLYLASHGSRTAELASELSDYHSVQPISAASTAEALRNAGISRRVVVVSACFAATWIPALADDNTIVITAAAKDRTSFGCDDSRRLTLFGETFLGSLAKRGISLSAAFDDAKQKISAKEAKEGITPSRPQAYVGRNMRSYWTSTAADRLGR